MRPKVICHMISSVDGRLITNRWTPPAKGIDPSIRSGIYEQVASRLGGEGWIVGRKSMEPFTKGRASTAASARLPREAFVGTRRDCTLAVAVDPHGRLHYGASHAGDEHFVAVLGEQVSDAYLAELRADGVSYLFAGADGTDLGRAMEGLAGTFGVRTLLLEGGGLTNGHFLKAGLIDEISLIVAPAIDGLAGMPSIFEYVGAPGERPAAGRALRHTATETLEAGFVWLRYAVEPSPTGQ